ncbi:MAG: hypothetical protein ACK43N_10905, partial [Pirellulaceae bacterium]
YPSSSPGPVGPGRGGAAPPGLVWWVNTRFVASREVHRNLIQARRADTRTAGGDSHRWDIHHPMACAIKDSLGKPLLSPILG